MAQTTFAPRPTALCTCRFASTAPAHHDQLLQAGSDVAMALELVELALTWSELDYSQEELIPPQHWMEFAADHIWQDSEVALRLFSAAVDIVRGARVTDRR